MVSPSAAAFQVSACDDPAEHRAAAAQRKARMISMISDRAGEHDPGERGVQVEQERQQHDERDQIEEGGQQLAGQEFADLVDLGDLYIVSPAGWRSK